MKIKTLTHSLALLAISNLMAKADLVGEWNFANSNLNDTVSGATHRLIYQMTNIQVSAVYTNDTPFGPSNALSGVSLSLAQYYDNAYVLGSTNGYGESTNMTYTAWVKINGWGTNASTALYQSIFSKQGGAGFRMVRFSTNLYTAVQLNGAGGGNALDSVKQVNVADNNWHLLAFTYGNSNLVYYIDGVAITSKTCGYNFASTTTLLSIGAWSTAGIGSMNGLIYDIRIYNNALPAWQIASLTNKPATVLFSDTFNAAVSTNLFDPTGRATGTLSTNMVYYGWSTTNDLAVNGTLSWAADMATNGFNELTNGNSTSRNLHFAVSPNSATQFDWYPYVSNQVWDVDFDEITANSQPLGLGVTSSPQTGAYAPWDVATYDFGFGNYGTAARWDIFNQAGANANNIANIFASKSTVYHVRIQFNEPLNQVTMFVNGTQIAQTNDMVFAANHRYLVWGEPSKFGGWLDNLQLSVEPSIPVAPFAVIPAAPNLIANANFSQTANAVVGSPGQPTTFNLNGSFGDYSAFWGNTITLLNWSPYYSDPYGLTTNVDPQVNNPSYALNGTFYLDTLLDTSKNSITLNSGMYYLNGLIQTNILNGVTIKPGSTYQFMVDPYEDNLTVDNFYATFTAGLTVGSGANATNTAAAVPGSLISAWIYNLPTVSGTFITNTVSGSDLIAAQSSGPVNVVFNQITTNTIASYPNYTSGDVDNLADVSQVRLFHVLLTVVSPLGDLNHDGVVDQTDVNLAQLYLSGNGGDSATNRENTLINTYGFTKQQALAYLNLTAFDINGDGYFDAADVAALQAMVGTVVPTLSSVSPNPVTGSSYPVTLSLAGSGFTGATAVLLTNLTTATGSSYSPVVSSDTSISLSFVPGTAASSWNATVVNGTSSAQVGFTVNSPTPVTVNPAALTSAGAGNLVLSGSGGGAGNSYVVLSATNLTPPVVWTPVATNAFNGSGSFSYTNPVVTATPDLFLRISQ